MHYTFALGNVCADPEVRNTPNGKMVCEFRLASNGFGKDDTEFYRCVAWERKAEVIAEHVKKGSKLAVQGRIKTREWEDKDGNKRYTQELIINDFEFCGASAKKGPQL